MTTAAVKQGVPGCFIYLLVIFSLNRIECKNLEKVVDASGVSKRSVQGQPEPQPPPYAKNLIVYNFTIPRNDPIQACIKMEAAFYFETTYQTKLINGTHERRVNFTLSDLKNFKYFGVCSPDRNLIEFEFFDDWNLKFYFYKLNNKSFVFNHVVLYYKFSGSLYPNSLHNGAQSEIYDEPFINSSLHQSYSCKSGIRIELGNVLLHMYNIRVQPFFNKRPGLPFDSEVICAADRPPPETSSSLGFWIFGIIASTLFVLVVLFIFFRVTSDDKTNENKVKTEYSPIR